MKKIMTMAKIILMDEEGMNNLMVNKQLKLIIISL